MYKLWRIVTGIIAIEDTTNRGATDVKDAAVRILFSCTSTPEDYWRAAVHTIIGMPYMRAFHAFQYIIHQFLKVSDLNIYEGYFELPSDTVTFLRRLDTNAKARGSEVTNPIDRFIMMCRQVITICPRHALTLLDAGMSDLLEAVLSGRYDKFFDSNEDVITPTSEGELDSLLSRSSIDSPITVFNHHFTVRRLPIDVRTGVCTSMVRQLKEAGAKSQSTASVYSPTSFHARMHRPLPKIPIDIDKAA
ncbi:hypothetical protein QCA50_014517 [Cerrena zonata]|uniref:Uncharacterized protein n=1 Tax=Cerrena zonata TaxID=2478898 RepID=A0AAW0FKU6_9APHY